METVISSVRVETRAVIAGVDHRSSARALFFENMEEWRGDCLGLLRIVAGASVFYHPTCEARVSL